MNNSEFELLSEIGNGTNSFQSPTKSDVDLAAFHTLAEKLKSLEDSGYIEILDERNDIVLVRITPDGQQLLLEKT